MFCLLLYFAVFSHSREPCGSAARRRHPVCGRVTGWAPENQLADVGGFGRLRCRRCHLAGRRPTPVPLTERYLANKPKPLRPSSAPMATITMTTTDPKTVIIPVLPVVV